MKNVNLALFKAKSCFSLFLFIAAYFVLTPQLFAKTPQQYCEQLEEKSPGSFEILNMDTKTESNMSSLGGQIFCNQGGSLNPFVLPTTLTTFTMGYTICGNNFVCEMYYNQLNPAQTEFNVGLASKSDSTPALCAGASLKAALNFSKTPLPELGLNCTNLKGWTSPSGSSCYVELSSAGTPGTLGYTATQVDVTTIVTLKYCARGVFINATVSSGPTAAKYDRILGCIRSNGNSTPGAFTTQPVRGELLLDFKKWLITKGGCAP